MQYYSRLQGGKLRRGGGRGIRKKQLIIWDRVRPRSQKKSRRHHGTELTGSCCRYRRGQAGRALWSRYLLGLKGSFGFSKGVRVICEVKEEFGGRLRDGKNPVEQGPVRR